MAKKNKQKRDVGEHDSLQDQLLNTGVASKEQLPPGGKTQRQNFKQMQNDIFLIDQTRLPNDTEGVLKNTEPDNFALKLNRRVLFKSNKPNEAPKPVLFKKKTKHDNEYKVGFVYDKKLIEDVANRQWEAIQGLGLMLEDIEVETDWRLVVGLGNESVYETSMTLDHVYGIPYIPASAVKGVMRNWIITEIFSETNDDKAVKNADHKGAETRAMDDKGFVAIFGNNDEAGKVRFFDAYPTTKPEIDTDIMNPHFGDYYGDQSGATPPADYLTPVPVPFLTVRDTTFRFVLGIKETEENSVVPEGSRLGQGSMLLDVASRWLEKALTEHGIGAKTAVGYGYMKSVHTGDGS